MVDFAFLLKFSGYTASCGGVRQKSIFSILVSMLSKNGFQFVLLLQYISLVFVAEQLDFSRIKYAKRHKQKNHPTFSKIGWFIGYTVARKALSTLHNIIWLWLAYAR